LVQTLDGAFQLIVFAGPYRAISLFIPDVFLSRVMTQGREDDSSASLLAISNVRSVGAVPFSRRRPSSWYRSGL
jgi:hypothetical protein